MLLNWSGAKEELGKKGPGILCLSGTSLAPKICALSYCEKTGCHSVWKTGRENLYEI